MSEEVKNAFKEQKKIAFGLYKKRMANVESTEEAHEVERDYLRQIVFIEEKQRLLETAELAEAKKRKQDFVKKFGMTPEQYANKTHETIILDALDARVRIKESLELAEKMAEEKRRELRKDLDNFVENFGMTPEDYTRKWHETVEDGDINQATKMLDDLKRYKLMKGEKTLDAKKKKDEFMTFEGVDPRDPQYWTKADKIIEEHVKKMFEAARTELSEDATDEQDKTEADFTTFEGVDPRDRMYWEKADRIINKKIERKL